MTDQEVVEVWYRCVDRSYAAPLDEYGDPVAGGASSAVGLQALKVVRHTPKGVWLADCGTPHYNYQRFVRLDARKQFACPTIEDALKSYLKRKERQASIYFARAEHAERFAKTAALMLKGELPFKNPTLRHWEEVSTEKSHLR